MATIETLANGQTPPKGMDWVLVETAEGGICIFNYVQDYEFLARYKGAYPDMHTAITEAVTIADQTGVNMVFVRAP